MSDRELLLRCHCGSEHVDIDLYFTRDSMDWNEKGAVEHGYFDEGYLTIQGWREGCPQWRDRVKSAWAAMRGRDYLLQSVILNPQDHARLEAFFTRGSEHDA